ncbi:unnamed protein product [Phyllotreta striolata]|uniref:Mitochondrial glycine transporter n=1 Tax=Phyllotreta striolata TaxID=444603 RepID=A0A9N9TE85_PHYSR|nr:unnamed protein product [Phyllotreta striolata]
MDERIKNVNNSDSSEEGEKKLHFPSVTVFLTGSLGAVVCSVLLQPFDVIKTRLQNPDTPLKGSKIRFRIFNILYNIYKHEHITALWYGTSATILRGLPAGGIYFCTYDWMRGCFYRNQWFTPFQHTVAAMTARAVTDIAVIPFSVVKTRIESGIFRYSNPVVGLTHIYRKEGFGGMTSGLLPILARDLPMSGIYIFFYKQAKSAIPYNFRKSNETLANSISAGIGATLSSFVTHPPDVLKTQMQLYPNKNPTLVSVVKNVYKEHGLKGFYQGIVPRIMKRAVFAAVAWTLYERVKTNKKG